MINLKQILFVFSFIILFTLICETTVTASPLQDAIDEALALIDEAINEALAVIEEAIDEDPAVTYEAFDDAFALIEGAIDEAVALVDQAIEEQVQLIDEQTIDEDFALPAEGFNEDIKNTIEAIAGRLTQNQVNVCVCQNTSCRCEATCCECEATCNECEATWPEEEDCTGSIVAGMVSAYEITDDYNCLTCAEQRGNDILSTADGSFCGGEVFALCCLSQISSDPSDNPWRTSVSDFYQDVKNSVGGTEGYIYQFARLRRAEPSTEVFLLAYYVVAAYYVDAQDKEIWREALINYLAQIDDYSSDFPVMALGIATWALATTGPLDDTLIDPSGIGAAYWSGKELADLPILILSHQVADGELYAGSFYRRFDHSDDGSDCCVSGYTEDAIFATLGLIRASWGNPALRLDAAIHAACQALLGAVNSDGKVVEHLGLQDSDCFSCGGKMLLVLGDVLVGNDIIIDDLQRIKINCNTCGDSF